MTNAELIQIDNYFKNWDRNSHGCLFTENGVPVTIDTVKAVVRNFYDLGCRHAAAEYDDIEYERQRRWEQEPKIRGWVARCKWPCPEELYFYRGEERPIRCGKQVEEVGEDFYWDFSHEVAPLNPSLFPDLKWEDEPIEVELTIHRV